MAEVAGNPAAAPTAANPPAPTASAPTAPAQPKVALPANRMFVRPCAVEYNYSAMPWDEVPVSCVPCPHQHFKAETIDRAKLGKMDHLALLATPKGYRWLGAADLEQPLPYTVARKERKQFAGYTQTEQRYIHEFLSEIWDLMTPEMIDSLKSTLVNEFGMTAREAEKFLLKQTVPLKKSKNIVPNIDLKSHWLKQFRRLMAAKLTDYIVSMISARRSKRTKMISEEILRHICDITGEKCTLNNPKSQVQRLQVFVADRLAAWFAQAVADADNELCKELKDKKEGMDGAFDKKHKRPRRPPPPSKSKRAKSVKQKIQKEKPEGKEETTPGESKSKPGSKPQTKEGSKPDSKPQSKEESKPGSKPQSKEGSKPDSKPGSKGASQPTSKRTSPPSSKGGSQPVSKGTSKPESKGASQPVSKGTSKPESKGASQPASKGASQPSSKGASKPVSKGASQPASKGPSQPSSKGPSKPVSKGASQPASKGPSQPSSKGPSKPVSKGASQPASKGPSQPSSKGPSKPTSMEQSASGSKVGSKPPSKHESVGEIAENKEGDKAGETGEVTEERGEEQSRKETEGKPREAEAEGALEGGEMAKEEAGGALEGGEVAKEEAGGALEGDEVAKEEAGGALEGGEVAKEEAGGALEGDEVAKEEAGGALEGGEEAKEETGALEGDTAGGPEETEVEENKTGGEGEAFDIPVGTVPNYLAETIIDTVPERSSRQTAIEDVIQDELKDADFEPEILESVALKLSTYIDKLVGEAEKLTPVEKLKPHEKPPSLPLSPTACKSHIFQISKGEKGCYYDVKSIDEKSACEQTFLGRSSRAPITKNEICMEPQPVGRSDTKLLVDWASNAVNFAEKWVRWINSTCKEATELASTRRKGDDSWKADWLRWRKQKETVALELKRNKKWIEEMKKKWDRNAERLTIIHPS